LGAEVTVTAERGDPGQIEQIEAGGSVALGNGRGMARRTDRGAIRPLREQTPADVSLAVPARALVKIAETPAICRATVPAGHPLAINLRVTVSTVAALARVRGGIDPLIIVVILFRDWQKVQIERGGAEGSAGAEVA